MNFVPEALCEEGSSKTTERGPSWKVGASPFMQTGLGVQALGLPMSFPEYRFTNATPDSSLEREKRKERGEERNEGEK